MDNHSKTSAEYEKLLEELSKENALLKSNLETLAFTESDKEIKNLQINFEKFFNLSLDLLCIADTDGYFIKVNEAWGKVLGYNIQDLEGKKFTNFIHLDDLESTFQAINDLSKQKQVIDFVNRYRASDGSWRYIEWYSQPIGKYIYAAARDITEHVNAKKALLLSEERFSLVIDASELGIWDWDIKSNEVFYSPQWKQQLGFADSELKNDFKSWEDLLHPDDYDRMHEEVANFLAKPSKHFVAEFRMRHKNGSYVWIHNKASAKKDEQGNVIRFFGAHTDITERKNAELQLKEKNEQIEAQNEEYRQLNEELMEAKARIEENEKRYRILVENAFDGVFLISKKRFFFVNSRFCEITGFTYNELVGESKDFRELVAKRSLKIVEEVYQSREKGFEGTAKYDVQIVRKDGEERTVEIATVPIIDDSSVLIMGIMKDNTQRRKMEREIAQRTRLQSLLMNFGARFINMPYNRINEELDNALAEIGTYTGVDRVYIFSYNWEMDTMSNTHEWCAKGVSSEIENLQDLPNNTVSHWIKMHREGKPIHIPNVEDLPLDDMVKQILEPQSIKTLITIPMIHEDKCMGFVGFDAVGQTKQWGDAEISLLKLFAELLVNVQVKANFEHWLKEAKAVAEYRQLEISKIIEFSPVGIAHISIDGRVLEINKAAIEMLGAPSQDVLLPVNVLDNEPLNKFGFIASFKECIESRSIVSKETRYISSWGKTIFIRYSVVPIVKDDRVQSVLANVEDISSVKETEKKLIALKEKAEESDRLKSAFLANMSHEIRTPMNAICGFSNLLLDKTISNDQKEEFVEIININGQQLLGIINDIIDISKIEAGQITISKIKFSLNELIRELKTMFGQTCKIKNIELTYDLGLNNNESLIYSDEMKIRQVLNNIIFNAIKFTETGSIKYGYSLKKDFLQFYVKDTGIGIPEDKYKIIFERFQQVDNATNHSRKGTGLGLPISKAFIEMLGGKIWFTSEPNKGTTFLFTIPYISASIIDEPKEAEISIDLSLGGKTILIAEDDDPNYQYLECLLETTRAEIMRAKNGQEVIDICKDNKVDLILMDLKMPLKSGIEATKELRGLGISIPIIAQTAYAFSEDKEMAINSGCNLFISKPIEPTELFKMINGVMKGRNP